MRTIVSLIAIITVCYACAQTPEKIDNADILKQAEQYRGQKNFKMVYELIKPLADKGDLEANYELASLYRIGEGENPYYNTTKAIELLYIGARQGHARSQSGLGLSLQHSLFDYKAMKPVVTDPAEVKRIRKEACEWITKGALQGAGLATIGVAECHKKGDFTGKPDYLQAYVWYAVPGFYKNKGDIYEDINDNVLMRQMANRGNLTDPQKQQAQKMAKEIADQIQAALAKNPLYN